jgi:hypothetical protein
LPRAGVPRGPLASIVRPIATKAGALINILLDIRSWLVGGITTRDVLVIGVVGDACVPALRLLCCGCVARTLTVVVSARLSFARPLLAGLRVGVVLQRLLVHIEAEGDAGDLQRRRGYCEGYAEAHCERPPPLAVSEHPPAVL